MSKHNSNTSKDSMMEAYYKMIGDAHVVNIAKELSSKADEIEQVNVPKSLDDWFDSFESRRKKEKNRKKWMILIKKMTSRVAVFVAIFITFMTVITLSVEGFRIRMFNFFLEKNETFTIIEKREDESNQVRPDIELESFYYLSYLPSGYRYEKYSIFGNEIIIQYTNGDEIIIFDQDKGNANYQIDTEDAIIQEIPLGDSSGQLIKKGERIMLFWSDNEDSFLIRASITEKELIKMAESLKKNK